MKPHKILLLLTLTLIMFSCKKESPCFDVKFEISSSNTASIDSIDFRMAGTSSSYSNPDESRFYTNLSLPYSETVTLCKEDFDYNLRCYDSDTNTILTLKIYSNGVLIKQKTSSPNNFVELAGGIND